MKVISRRLLGGAAIFAIVAAACSSGGSSPAASQGVAGASAAGSSAAGSAGGSGSGAAASGSAAGGGAGGPAQTVTWWHNANNDPGKSWFQNLANQYTQSHPNVTFKIQAMQNEDFKTKIPLALNSGSPPDIFQSWGGGGLAQQVQAGKVQDITSTIQPIADTILPAALDLYKINGKIYGVPYDLGLVGFWYNKDIFSKAGITSPPATWTDFLSDVDKLKGTGVAPIALGEKDTWPGAFWWEYLGLRECGKDGLQKTVQNKSFQDGCWVKAGKDLQQLVQKNPFNPGFQATPAQTGATSAAGLLANGKAAMELQGQWEPSVLGPLSANGKGLGDKLGWFGFPTIQGAPGLATEYLGGGNGFAVAKNAPPAAADFLKLLESLPVQKSRGALNDGILPTTKGAETSVTDPNLQALLQARGKATFVQLYLDQTFSAQVGQAINDAVAGLFAGASAPEDVQAAVQQAASR